jgi:hypothetical protein
VRCVVFICLIITAPSRSFKNRGWKLIRPLGLVTVVTVVTVVAVADDEGEGEEVLAAPVAGTIMCKILERCENL